MPVGIYMVVSSSASVAEARTTCSLGFARYFSPADWPLQVGIGGQHNDSRAMKGSDVECDESLSHCRSPKYPTTVDPGNGRGSVLPMYYQPSV